MSQSQLPSTMKAVVFDAPFKVSVQDRPTPKLQHAQDIIVKVQATALCGSELHVFRGHQVSETGFIMGHEFTGIIVEAGDEVKTVKVGDKVVTPFTTSWDGGQAEFVRIPYADGTVTKAPPEIDDKALILMADIFPTGYFGAKNAFRQLSPEEKAGATVVVVGCGPVGLCAIIAALEYKPKHLFAVDSIDSRLELAKKLGAEPLNFMTDKEGMLKRVKEASDGRGADAVIEVVGLSPALRTAFDLLRPFGVISSIGVHNAEIPYSGSEAYGKNLRIQTGRCPVRSVFPEALEVLARNQDKLSFMFDKIMPLSSAVEGYDLFNSMKAQKIIFTP
ncbi:putative alcohol dehydrogenase protein [Phaeoacremonium minimum UCRPA7]|uniref:Putative alcohol dehydrogenase protein n=1 Tax=Phaeoacremonium minimum (strain UCR-PA7) TaxID=1286976 RepID=R8BFR5_PHAM7|nr:putative alcohol dehydrogenase protein [Phaeoacremonium minimum UCRPA7]EON98151.1 putative alcohol dehydrogenase protein [Phaeoacremonium minimum UCRPA7]